MAIAGVLLAALTALLCFASSSRAAELAFWDNYPADTIGVASIDGSGGGLLNLTGATLTNPEGMAIDTVTGRLFVASSGETGVPGQIIAVNLNGTGASVFSAPGAPVDSPEGVVVDPVTRMIYWANTGTGLSKGSIAWAKLDGSAGGVLNTTGTTAEAPYKIGLDAVAGRVYWANTEGPSDTIGFANANNTGGGGILDVTGATPPESITGFSVDHAAGRVYWLENREEVVSFAGLLGGNAGDLDMTGATIADPYGLAFDPKLGRFYWGNYASGSGGPIGAIGTLNLAGGGGAINVASTPVKGPQDPLVLKSPTGTAAPESTRTSTARSTLLCSTGKWAADYAESFVYQAPTTFAYQWTHNGTPIAGASAATFTATTPGSYGCTVTATNQAGSAAQASTAATQVKASKLKLVVKTKKVTAKPGKLATFKIQALNQGDLTSKSTRLCVKVPKKAKKDLKVKCNSLGKVKAGAKPIAKLKVKVGGSAAGRYKLKILVRGSAGKSVKATLKVVG